MFSSVKCTGLGMGNNKHNFSNHKWDALRDLVPFVQFKKCENTHAGVLLLVELRTVLFSY